MGVPFASGYNLPYQEHGRDRVEWRFIVELSSTVGAKQVHEVHVGGNATPGCSAATLGLSLAEAKSVLAPTFRTVSSLFRVTSIDAERFT